MPNQPAVSIENNFTKGLVTEFTGLNFPENAATDTDNCEYTLVGDVVRRRGIDLETNFLGTAINRTGKAVNTYKWNNVGGDGSTQLVVAQVGKIIRFYSVTAATSTNPLSRQLLGSTIDLSVFIASGGSMDETLECQFTDGNGYLFIFHPSCDPVYCTYVAGVITGTAITVKIRDFTGVVDGLAASIRPGTLSVQHQYNIANQGWIKGTPWSGTSTSSVLAGTGVKVFTTQAGLTVNIGDVVNCYGKSAFGFGGYQLVMWGTVTGYVGTTLTLNIGAVIPTFVGTTLSDWQLVAISSGYVDTFKTATGTYPSNSDVWWYFKNAVGGFDPATTINNVTLSSGRAPQGHYILDAFNQQKTIVSSLSGITSIVTTQRPANGCWFQGRVWYTGLNASQAALGDENYYTWTENIYFSQAIVNSTDFGNCYQENDPTSETLFDILPTDGGVIVIQGSGPIYKLFPIQNGLLVFAANGVWFITGSQGIGFAANDYTITKISSVKSLSTTSFVDVLGLPYFWNEDGIYAVMPQQGGGLNVQIITYNTIDSFYAEIPLTSKKYVRGDYDPINYLIKWIYRSTEASLITDRYSFDKILNYNTSNQAFFPYTISTNANINSINYISGPGGSTCPPPAFKHYTSYAGVSRQTFSDEHDTDYVDWASTSSADYTSYFITGYKLHGQGQRRFQVPYVYMYSRITDEDEGVSYKIQGIWDYATSSNSGRWSTAQLTRVWSPNFGMVFKRHKIRGQGIVLQIKVQSVSREPLDIMGWSIYETSNAGV